MYYWVVHPTHGYSQKVSNGRFKTKKEAYESMRNSALYRMKWNTEFDEFFGQGELINYEIKFSRDCIRCISCFGDYIYKIVREGAK